VQQDLDLAWLLQCVVWMIVLIPVAVAIQQLGTLGVGLALRLVPVSVTFGCGPRVRTLRLGRTVLTLNSHPRVGVVEMLPRTPRAVLARMTAVSAVHAVMPVAVLAVILVVAIARARSGQGVPMPVFGLVGAAMHVGFSALHRPWGDVWTVGRALRRPDQQRAQATAIAASGWVGQTWDGIRPATETFPQAVRFARAVVWRDLERGFDGRLTQFGKFGTASAFLLADRPLEAAAVGAAIEPTDPWWTWLRADIEADSLTGLVEQNEGRPLVDGDAETCATLRQRIRDAAAEVVRGVKDPASPLLLGTYATLALVEGRPTLAEDLARRLLEARDESALSRKASLIVLAAALRAQHRDDEARAVLDEARALDPGSPRPGWVESFRWPVVEGPEDPDGLLAKGTGSDVAEPDGSDPDRTDPQAG
jgi:hypothetical protein